MGAVSFKKVRFAYPDSLGMHFNFEVAQGERLAIMGGSGSGKSTLLHLIAGFEIPQSGSINFSNVEMTDTEPAARPVSILFQDNNLFAHMTVAQNVGLGIAPRLRLSKNESETVDAALAKVGLSGMAKRLPSELSGGERQRAALARSLLRDKPVLLLDEPFAALGPAMRIEMLDLVTELQAAKNQTIIMVTHSPDDAAYFATQIGFVENGQLSAIVAAAALENPPKGSPLGNYIGSKQIKS
jgi:thiamine transport system ATP-binding protein